VERLTRDHKLELNILSSIVTPESCKTAAKTLL